MFYYLESFVFAFRLCLTLPRESGDHFLSMFLIPIKTVSPKPRDWYKKVEKKLFLVKIEREYYEFVNGGGRGGEPPPPTKSSSFLSTITCKKS